LSELLELPLSDGICDGVIARQPPGGAIDGLYPLGGNSQERIVAVLDGRYLLVDARRGRDSQGCTWLLAVHPIYADEVDVFISGWEM
jgi:hypothetical protein